MQGTPGSKDSKVDEIAPAGEPIQNHSDIDDKDDDLPEEHIKGLDEALKGADRGEPVTLKEFKKMAKKWGSK